MRFNIGALLGSVLVFAGVLMLAELVITVLAPFAGANILFYIVAGVVLIILGTWLVKPHRR